MLSSRLRRFEKIFFLILFLKFKFLRFDLYTKPVEDCRVKTSFGGIGLIF